MRNIGFSFHAGPELLDRILDEHPEVDFVQLQTNYADWENPDVQSHANYDVAVAHGKPVKGGNLANPPADVARLLREAAPDASAASWAIRFAASLPGVMCVLSGMSNVAQMKDNLSYMREFKPLSQSELRVIREAQRLLGHASTIPCTACHYCTAGCPRNIPIPEIFGAMNKQLGGGLEQEAREAYTAATSAPGAGPASSCIGCRQCERACPQHLHIVDELRLCTETLER